MIRNETVRTPSDDATDRSVGPRSIPLALPIQKGSLPAMPMLWRAVLRRAALRYATLCCAVPRCGTVCRAILSRVAWLVVSFLYSFVGKSAASLVFKRRQRGSAEEGKGRRGRRAAARQGERTEAKGKRRPASGVARGSEGAGRWLGDASCATGKNSIADSPLSLSLSPSLALNDFTGGHLRNTNKDYNGL